MNAEDYAPDDWDDEEPTEPEMVGPDAQPTDDDNEHPVVRAMRQGPIMAADFWDSDYEPPQPELGAVEGALPLFYVGMTNVIIGEPGRGKSLLSQWQCVDLAKQGIATLYVDFEKNYPQFLARIRALGASKEDAARIGYWRLTKDLNVKALARILDFIDTFKVALVVVDSVGRALSRGGYEENSNDQVRAWFDTAVAPLQRAGLTILLVDHFKKPDTGGRNGGSPGDVSRFAKGAGAKLDVIDGVAYGLQFVVPFSQHHEGFALLLTAKDNNGARHEGEKAAEMKVTPGENGEIHVSLCAPAKPQVDTEGNWLPTVLMERVSVFLEGQAEPVSKNYVATSVKGEKREAKFAAIAALERLGFIELKVKGSSHLLSSLKPFRKDEFEDSPEGPGANDPF